MKITQEILSLCEVPRIHDSLVPMTLKEYLNIYGFEIEDYYEVLMCDFEEIDSDTSILCLVDMNDEQPSKRRKKSPGRRAGLERRLKFRHRYTYKNPMNRILAYCVIENSQDELVVKLSLICSSYFSHYKGVGTEMMNITLAVVRLLGYRDIVLELANEYSQEPEEDEDEEDEEDEEDDESLTEMIDTLSHELWRKCVRMREKKPYYNVDQPYIQQVLHEYLREEIYESADDDDSDEETEIALSETMREEYGYNGYWNRLAKQSQAGLIRFYETFGFIEDETQRCHFSTKPYPTFVNHLYQSSL